MVDRTATTPLTPKEWQFVQEYAIDKNGADAVRRAGYNQKPAAAAVTASRLLRKANVKAALAKALQDQTQATKITAERILEEIGRVALLDLRQAFTPEGNLKKLVDMPEEIARCIAGVDIDEIWTGNRGDREVIGQTSKIKCWDKVRALELYAKHFKLLTDVVQVQLVDNIADRLKEARLRRASKK